MQGNKSFDWCCLFYKVDVDTYANNHPGITPDAASILWVIVKKILVVMAQSSRWAVLRFLVGQQVLNQHRIGHGHPDRR